VRVIIQIWMSYLYDPRSKLFMACMRLFLYTDTSLPLNLNKKKD